MSDYLPIACIEHERLEFAVLRRQRLALEFQDGGGAVWRGVVLPTDVVTRDGAEWLSYTVMDGGEAGNAGVVRLDRILSARPASA